jgi:hypothetical protein
MSEKADRSKAATSLPALTRPDRGRIEDMAPEAHTTSDRAYELALADLVAAIAAQRALAAASMETA